jgi:hypothetical protein
MHRRLSAHGHEVHGRQPLAMVVCVCLCACGGVQLQGLLAQTDRAALLDAVLAANLPLPRDPPPAAAPAVPSPLPEPEDAPGDAAETVKAMVAGALAAAGPVGVSADVLSAAHARVGLNAFGVHDTLDALVTEGGAAVDGAMYRTQ